MVKGSNQANISDLPRKTKPTDTTTDSFKEKLSSLSSILEKFEKNEIKQRKKYFEAKSDLFKIEKVAFDDRLSLFKEHYNKKRKIMIGGLSELEKLEHKYFEKRTTFTTSFYETVDDKFNKIRNSIKKWSITAPIDQKRTIKEETTRQRTIGFYDHSMKQSKKTNALLEEGIFLQHKKNNIWSKLSSMFSSIFGILKIPSLISIIGGAIALGLLGPKVRNFLFDIVQKAAPVIAGAIWEVGKGALKLGWQGLKNTFRGIFGAGASGDKSGWGAGGKGLLPVPPIIPPTPSVTGTANFFINRSKKIIDIGKKAEQNLKGLRVFVDTAGDVPETAKVLSQIAKAEQQISRMQKAEKTLSTFQKIAQNTKKVTDFLKRSKVFQFMAKRAGALKIGARTSLFANVALAGYDIMELTSKHLTETAEREQAMMARDIDYTQSYKTLDDKKWEAAGISGNKRKEAEQAAGRLLRKSESYRSKIERFNELETKLNKGSISAKELQEKYRLQEIILGEKRKKTEEILLNDAKGDVERTKKLRETFAEYNRLQRELRKENLVKQKRERFEERIKHDVQFMNETRGYKGFLGIETPLVKKMKSPEQQRKIQEKMEYLQEQMRTDPQNREEYEYELFKLEKRNELLGLPDDRPLPTGYDTKGDIKRIQKYFNIGKNVHLEGIHPEMARQLAILGKSYFDRNKEKLDLNAAVRTYDEQMLKYQTGQGMHPLKSAHTVEGAGAQFGGAFAVDMRSEQLAKAREQELLGNFVTPYPNEGWHLQLKEASLSLGKTIGEEFTTTMSPVVANIKSSTDGYNKAIPELAQQTNLARMDTGYLKDVATYIKKLYEEWKISNDSSTTPVNPPKLPAVAAASNSSSGSANYHNNNSVFSFETLSPLAAYYTTI